MGIQNDYSYEAGFISEGHADVILFLLNVAKVRPDPKDRWQRTPLHDAQSEKHIECVRLLEKAMTVQEVRFILFIYCLCLGRGRW